MMMFEGNFEFYAWVESDDSVHNRGKKANSIKSQLIIVHGECCLFMEYELPSNVTGFRVNLLEIALRPAFILFPYFLTTFISMLHP